MKHLLMMTVATVAVSATGALAGGIERTSQSAMILFEKGNYAELSFSHVSPSVSGVATAFSPTPGAASGNMAESFSQIGLAYKHQFTDRISAAIIYDTPFGANANYPAGTVYFNQGANAEINSNSITGLVKYTTPENFSVFGGLRYQTMEARANIPIVGLYTVSTSRDGSTGFVLGTAWERPEMALRVALTYNSAIEHTVISSETSVLGTSTTPTTFETPQSLNLEFQSGVAADTLVFGSVRWVDWTSFELRPDMYANPLLANAAIVSYQNDVITYNIGVGRKFSDAWSGAVTLGYEKSEGGFASNLGPTDGFLSIGVGATYTMDNMKITAGVRYVDIGDAQTTLGGGVAAANFDDNDAVAVGVRIGFSF